MAERAVRHDGYGAPLPDLVDARREVLYDRPANQAQRSALVTHLDQACRELLRRGVYAEVTLRWAIQDGVIQEEVHVHVTRTHRHTREP